MLLLGAGEMAEAAAKSLGKGARALRICNRSFDGRGPGHGRSAAASPAGTRCADELRAADVVVASTAAARTS